MTDNPKSLTQLFVKLFGNSYLIDEVIEQEYQCIVKYQKQFLFVNIR